MHLPTFLSSVLFNIIKYISIFTLYHINKNYYASLKLLYSIPSSYILYILMFMLVISSIYHYNLKKSSSLCINYYLQTFFVILYVVLLIDLELILASLICIIIITYLYFDSLLDLIQEKYKLCSFLNIILILICINFLISNICIVLFNM